MHLLSSWQSPQHEKITVHRLWRSTGQGASLHRAGRSLRAVRQPVAGASAAGINTRSGCHPVVEHTRDDSCHKTLQTLDFDSARRCIRGFDPGDRDR